MISLPSFFKKSSNPQAKLEPSFRSRNSKLDSALSQEDLPQSENPEIQRARHRLIGAAFLLLIAVIGLPKLFDAQPKKVNNDVAVKVVQSVAQSVSPTPNEKDVTAEIKENLKPLPEKVPSENNTIVPAPALQTPPSKEGANLSKGSIQTEPGEVVVSNSPVATKNDSKDVESKSNSKFIIQVAALTSSEKVKALTGKIKDLKIANYVLEKKKDNDGGVIYLVRAGPFTSKEDALNAEKKIIAIGMGLVPKLVEINK